LIDLPETSSIDQRHADSISLAGVSLVHHMKHGLGSVVLVIALINDCGISRCPQSSPSLAQFCAKRDEEHWPGQRLCSFRAGNALCRLAPPTSGEDVVMLGLLEPAGHDIQSGSTGL
jgi:hypothetical protein